MTPPAVMIGAGKTYTFVVEARNVIGYSPVSTGVAILASTIPAQPVAPTTSPLEAEYTVTISWPALTNPVA